MSPLRFIIAFLLVVLCAFSALITAQEERVDNEPAALRARRGMYGSPYGGGMGGGGPWGGNFGKK
uniref:Uncharacterized protein n=1 Tax=Heterodera glycines TaxID=51029 RepID=Q5I5I9_HETGL|nr:unknown [Heterodera glycines]